MHVQRRSLTTARSKPHSYRSDSEERRYVVVRREDPRLAESQDRLRDAIRYDLDF